MKFNDVVPGVLMFLFSIFILISAKDLPSLPGYEYGAGFFPSLVALALLISSVILIVKGVRSRAKIMVLGDWVRSPKLVSNIVLIPLNLVFYIVFVEKIGFILTSTTMLTVTIWWLRGRLLSTVITSVCVSLFAYGFFYKFMAVPLPQGLFGF